MVRGTTMANKTRSRSKGGGSGCSDSPLIDLTSYGFSRGSGKKRAASAATPPATPADGGDVPDDDDDDDDDDDGSPPKRARPEEDGGGTITSAGDDDGSGAGGGCVCDPSSSSSPPPSLGGMADACVDAILLAGVVGGRQQRLRRKEQRGDDVRVGGLGGSVGVGVGDDDVAGRGTRRGGGDAPGLPPRLPVRPGAGPPSDRTPRRRDPTRRRRRRRRPATASAPWRWSGSATPTRSRAPRRWPDGGGVLPPRPPPGSAIPARGRSSPAPSSGGCPRTAAGPSSSTWAYR